jgi:hypothetical protein
VDFSAAPLDATNPLETPADEQPTMQIPPLDFAGDAPGNLAGYDAGSVPADRPPASTAGDVGHIADAEVIAEVRAALKKLERINTVLAVVAGVAIVVATLAILNIL